MKIEFLEDPEQRSIAISVVLNIILFSILVWQVKFDLFTVATTLPVVIFFGSIPYLYYQYNRFNTLRAIEDNLPGFLRDITAAHRSGMSLPQAIIGSSRTEYGPLSAEVKKMAAQLSWGIPFPAVIIQFSTRMKGSAYIQRSISIIMEAYTSGGDITDAMESVASNARILKDMEADRSSKLSQQVMIMYVIFLIFLGMLVALHKILTPLFSLQQAGEYGGSAFMRLSYGPSYYRTLFFHMVLIQAFFNGVLAGQLGEGSVIAGLKHSAIMMGAGLVVFTFFLPEIVMTIEMTAPERAIPHGSVFELKGAVAYIEGEPVANADVAIKLEETVYRTTTDEAGVISYRLTMPEVAGTYPIEITITEPQGRKESTTMDVMVS